MIADTGQTSIWIWVLGMLLFVFAVVNVFRENVRRKANLRGLAQRLGLTNDAIKDSPDDSGIEIGVNRRWLVSSPSDQSRSVSLTGLVRGKRILFSEYNTGSGKSTVHWAELAVAAKGYGLEFALTYKNLGWKFLEVVGVREIKTGDPEFDRRWHIRSEEPEIMLTLLLPELRAQIDQLAGAQSAGVFFLENGMIRFRQRGGFYDSKLVAHYESMVDLMCALSDAIEVVAQKNKEA